MVTIRPFRVEVAPIGSVSQIVFAWTVVFATAACLVGLLDWCFRKQRDWFREDLKGFPRLAIQTAGERKACHRSELPDGEGVF
jgi:hypothetical protein